ncbi:N-acetyl-1-D-myo-inositol-2-amino-2-deoxy-alpha-D-glucopyranoside deacetylase [Kallotenue papyrolyticum]|uniref:N-acetyl-1-D-myo-inositol-2-amino-2-deoxy-alpha- D-glucopyranoside deacetylase n=1 Tax=Kallotenue papyrolyticum TaxID=1325125 RepID=UPI00047861F3|nr:N-acetyl-1-D-myo-inositol-2-amino-2-deoxy-alpha-D-glucopyranoside deacetylase [Kallotenue papyrolyticum]
MAEPLTLMIVHAHPDDEAIGTGGTLARYADEGVRTVLVTCTLGEEGEIVVPEWDTPDHHARLGEIRYEELRAAAALLGVQHLELLGYRDSGMMGRPSNAHPECFWQADLDEATARLVRLVRRYRPQVLVSYNEQGGYGHPDHLQAHRITVAAFDAAGDPRRYPEAGRPWTPLKLYYISFRRALWLTVWQRMRERGLPTPMDAADFDAGGYVDDPRTTTTIDVSRYLARKLEAIRVHRTQIRPDWSWLAVPEDLRDELLTCEHFIRVASRVPVPPGEETDLFAGVRAHGSNV